MSKRAITALFRTLRADVSRGDDGIAPLSHVCLLQDSFGLVSFTEKAKVVQPLSTVSELKASVSSSVPLRLSLSSRVCAAQVGGGIRNCGVVGWRRHGARQRHGSSYRGNQVRFSVLGRAP